MKKTSQSVKILTPATDEGIARLIGLKYDQLHTGNKKNKIIVAPLTKLFWYASDLEVAQTRKVYALCEDSQIETLTINEYLDR